MIGMPSAVDICRRLSGKTAVGLIASLLHATGLSAVSVSAGGQAVSAIPISVPPGIAGMVPQLSLTYIDGGPNGPVGVGWSVQGVSIVARCPSVRAIDGFGRNVDFTPGDHLCLDGQRLVRTDEAGVPHVDHATDAAGLPQGQYREFRTEKDSFARIRAYGSENGHADNGPEFIRVWTKSGQLFEYGAQPSGDNSAQALITAGDSFAEVRSGRSATVVAVWAVRRASDVSGNYIDFRYEQRAVAVGSTPVNVIAPLAREWVPVEIRYTGNGGQAPANKIVFDYVDRIDAPPGANLGLDTEEAYQFDRKNASLRLLKGIRTFVGQGAVAVAYTRLDYSPAPISGRSRLVAVSQCSGRLPAQCFSPTVIAYESQNTVAAFAANPGFTAGPLARLAMTDTAASVGVLTGDFFGSGRTDVLRWSSTASDNQLWRSAGDGAFQAATGFNVTADLLFSADGCYRTVVADFNGDGLSDLLRTVQGAGCRGALSLLFLSRGDGSFDRRVLPADIVLQQRTAVSTFTAGECPIPNAPSDSVVVVSAPALVVDRYGPGRRPAGSQTIAPPPGSEGDQLCWRTTRTEGRRFYVLDVDGDGILDLVTTIALGFTWFSNWGPVPSEEDLCRGAVPEAAPQICTRVYKGGVSGDFVELPGLLVAFHSLYSEPPRAGSSAPFWRLPEVADIDGDGLSDILSSVTGNWRSLGNGDFAPSEVRDGSQVCRLPIDFNGDGRSDCLNPVAFGGEQSLSLSYGAANSGPIAQFNLRSLTDPLEAVVNGVQTLGVVVDDFDGDGRQDILRWGTSTADNGVYLSNGDGSFRGRQSLGLQSIPRPLQSADGATAFVLGDFLGNGRRQILHLKSNPPVTGGDEASLNQLYEMPGFAGPRDVLVSVTTPSGLTTTVTARVPLTKLRSVGGRYLGDRGTAQAALPPLVDLSLPMYVVATLTRDTGAGTIATEHLYAGLKAERGGRGLLGFREVHQASPTPDGGSLNVVAEYLQQFPFTGVAASSTTYLGALACHLPGSVPCTLAPPISTTFNSYCDRVGATVQGAGMQSQCTFAPGPLPPRSVRRPYLLTSIEGGRDLNQPALALPTITTNNRFNDFGDLVRVELTTVGKVGASGPDYVSTRVLDNVFCLPDSSNCPNRTTGDHWVLGRLMASAVTQNKPDHLSVLNAAAGSNPYALTTQGSGPLAPARLKTAVLATVIDDLLED